MEIKGKRIMLRDFIESDYEDHLRWRTTETEWMKWDSPWRVNDRVSVEDYSESRLLALKCKTDDDIRWTFEICTYPEGIHIGWSNCYCLDFFYNYSKRATSRYALGIDIVPIEYRGQGLGKEVFELFQNYLLSFGITRYYTQTWVGNKRMERMALSLGYEPINIKRNKFKSTNRKYDIVTFCLEY